MSLVSCNNCGLPYPASGVPYRCECGGIFGFRTYPEFVSPLDHLRDHRMWKYAPMFGLENPYDRVSLGEGDTPLVEGLFFGHKVFLKMESQNPTGSYKDRGSAVLVSFLLSRGVSEAVEDSSGNAGASFAAYASRAGIQAQLFIPESTSGPKLNQIRMYGADVVRVPGPRAEASRAVLEAVAGGKVYASHAYMPFGLTGIATIAYEIVESLKGIPGTLIAPVGHGGLLSGVLFGFEVLMQAGVIHSMPTIIGVQPENCSPIVQAFKSGSQEPAMVTPQPTIAEGTAVTTPVHGKQLLQKIHIYNGTFISSSEGEIRQTWLMLAKQGIFCEPTSALALTPLLDDKISLVEPVVSILTGSGLKTTLVE